MKHFSVVINSLSKISSSFSIRHLCYAVLCILICWQQGCDTGFGQPCEFPENQKLKEACETSNGTEEEEGTIKEFKASCAVDNFPQCETQSCITYRGSSSYCSMRCKSNSECEGSGYCCPLFGDCKESTSQDPNESTMDTPAMSMSNPCGGNSLSPCYCIRKADYNR